ncbi:MAG: hypothetical protein U0Q16_32900 [Bryobacteraceae bacterium]
MAKTASKSFFSEAEAARELGITIDEFRTLVKRHIGTADEDVKNMGVTAYHASNLLALRMLMAAGAKPSPVA